MDRKVIVTCAVTGGGDTVGKHPAVPVTPAEIATACVEAAKAGATVCHIHVRNPETGKPSMDPALYREVVARIRDSGTDLVINLTTGAGGRFVPGDVKPAEAGKGTNLATPAERVQHVEELRPEICSLDMGTMNFGPHVFMNTPAHLAAMAKAVQAAGVKPELEVFDSGHVRLANHFVESGIIEGTPLYQLCLGISWGQPATPAAMAYMRDLLPAGAEWAGFGISRMQFPMVAQAVLLGGHVRVGLEDNLYLDKGVFGSNAQLVEKAIRIIQLLGHEIATPQEARQMLKLRNHA
ncbi:3-keto-5-aminohexanoate cleavage protein [Stella sp.]|uniref:3-keto-5-aminohexanoate cleavage protein n=1 Tax=Stella sp. TaxID=2912054 RepID=UPI0035B2F9B8